MDRVKIRSHDRTRYHDYRLRADEFFHGMNDEESAGRCTAAALLGIHASIALTDAVTVFARGDRAADERHADAVKLLRSVCNAQGVPESGTSKLTSILKLKNDVAYGERFRTAGSDELRNLLLNVRRFFTWAYEHFSDLGARPDMEE